MKTVKQHSAAAILAVALLSLIGCGDDTATARPEPAPAETRPASTAGEKIDHAVQVTKDAVKTGAAKTTAFATKTGEKIKDGAERAGESVKEGATKVGESVKEGTEKVGDAFRRIGEKVKDATTK